MRVCGPVLGRFGDPDAWIAALQARGYRAAGWLPDNGMGPLAAEYAAAARKAGIVIGEICVWCSPVTDDPAARREALALCKQHLAAAETVGARCCVNVSGSRGGKVNEPDPRNLTEETFEMVVESVREIIDAVDPKATFYTLEPMPWMYPDTTDNYLRLIRAVDRKAFAVHYDPVNLVSTVQKYWNTGREVREFCRKLGPYIRAVHAKDILLKNELTLHMYEVRPGLGNFDYHKLVRELGRLDDEVVVAVEHLGSQEEFDVAAEHIQAVAVRASVTA